MGVIFFNEGLEQMFKILLNGTSTGMGQYLFLFVNNHTPDVADTFGNYTQCLTSTPIYGDLHGLFTISAAAGIVTCTAPVIDFVFGVNPTPDTIYGWLVFDNANAGTPLIFGRLLDAPIAIPTTGMTLRVSIDWAAELCPP